MVVKFSRSQRRHDRARLKKRTKQRLIQIFGHDKDWADKYCVHYIDNFTRCSCWMCCNARRSWISDSPLTMQERKEYEKFLYEIKDLEIS